MTESRKHKLLSANRLFGLLSFVFLSSLCPDIAIADTNDTKKHELFLVNQQNPASVQVTVEAIGMVFDSFKIYSNKASEAHTRSEVRGDPITGMVVTVLANGLGYIANHVNTSTPTEPIIPDRHIGYGKYKVTIGSWGSIYVDFTDANYGYSSSDGGISDIILKFNGDELLWSDTITSGGTEATLSPNDTIELWDQTRIGRPSNPRNKNGFRIESPNNTIPLDEPDAVVTHITPGNLFVNLEVQASAIVLSGKSFIIQEPGTQILFSPNKKLTVDGTLTAHGTSANPIVFTANGTSWNGIYFASGSSGSLRYCELDKISGGAGGAAITISGNSSPSIEYSTIDVLPGSYVFGVNASGGSYTSMNPKLHKSTVRSASAPAVYTSGSGGYLSVHDSDIIQTSGNPAVRASGGSSIGFWIAATIYDGKNKIKGGKLHVDGNALINAGESSGSKSKNHFCDASSATLQVASGGTIYAKYDYWPNGNPPTQINNGGTIYYSNNLGASDCSDVTMMASRVYETYIQGGASDVLSEAKAKASAGFYAEAIALFI